MVRHGPEALLYKRQLCFRSFCGAANSEFLGITERPFNSRWVFFFSVKIDSFLLTVICNSSANHDTHGLDSVLQPEIFQFTLLRLVMISSLAEDTCNFFVGWSSLILAVDSRFTQPNFLMGFSSFLCFTWVAAWG